MPRWSCAPPSVRPKDHAVPPPDDDPGNPTVNFHGETRRNATRQRTTDPDARLAKKAPWQWRRSFPSA
jgi:hypothetical protein